MAEPVGDPARRFSLPRQELSGEGGLVCAELGKLIRQSENILGDPTERILRLADLSFVVLD
jgi:hypothetical protein